MTQMMKPVRPATVPGPRARTDGLAIAGLILAFCWMGGLGSLIAVILTNISRGNARRAGCRPSAVAETGNWAAAIGLAAGAVIVLLVIMHASGH